MNLLKWVSAFDIVGVRKKTTTATTTPRRRRWYLSVLCIFVEMAKTQVKNDGKGNRRFDDTA